jgi:hypothetical protein
VLIMGLEDSQSDFIGMKVESSESFVIGTN